MKPLIFMIGTLLLSLPQTQAHEEVDYETTSEHQGLRRAAKLAIEQGDTALFDVLLKAGLEINKPVDPSNGRTALHEAVQGKKLDMIRHLLKQGADPLVRDKLDHRPIDDLNYFRGSDIGPIVAALKREPAEYDKKQLMEIPVPVWHEILGAPAIPDDPLAPPTNDSGRGLLIPFVSINGDDPAPEMTPALNAHFPNWKPGSRAVEVTLSKNENHPSSYWDKQTHVHGELVQIVIGGCTPQDVKGRNSDALAKQVNQETMTAYEFQVRRATGPAMSGGGWRGYVVPVVGYWVKVGTQGWDE